MDFSSSSSDSKEDAVIVESVKLTIEFMNEVTQGLTPQPLTRRPHLDRDHEAAHELLIRDYFSENPVYNENLFRRRFRMSRRLFLRVVEDLQNSFEFFQQRRDAREVLGFSGIHKFFQQRHGSIDCTHWASGNCPTAWRGQHERGDHPDPSIMLEVVDHSRIADLKADTAIRIQPIAIDKITYLNANIHNHGDN
ncbi:uncharacterized protein LOC118488798 [Helianthus annuus]|uniref:uncharacterized protein LOC118488798 n=1 Tax=Helianthus annuus TaxID=4232 RepID=UPI001652BD09|nr:uncharacterized protein LOC118488798 [Helianthus annuus]